MRTRFVASLVLLGTALAAHADGIREGKWEYTTKMTMANMPAMPQLPQGTQLPPGMKIPQLDGGGITHTFQQCVSNDKPVPEDDKHKSSCKTTRMDRSGDTITWAVHCESPDENMDGEGRATYDGNAMTSTMKLKGTSHGHPIDMTQDISGKYLGPCS